MNQIAQREKKDSKWWQCYWGYYVIITFVIIFIGLGILAGHFLNQHVTENHTRTLDQSSARHLGCQDWRLVNNSKCEKHLKNHENCQNDHWDCLENDEKEAIAKQICTLMKECCDFIRFQGTCEDVDFTYSWAWTLQEMNEGLKGWKECKKNKNIKWNLCTQM